MTTASDLLDAVRRALPAALGVNLTTQSETWDLYEAYAFARVLEAARADGYTVSYERLRGAAPNQTFVFRRGPGSIWSTAFSFAVLRYDPAPVLEVHVGVRVEGQSGVAHEADVSAILQSEANRARADKFAPRARACVFVIECKYYLATLKLSLLREFLGLTTDLRSHNTQHWLMANVSHAELPAMMKHHKRLWADNAVPQSDGERNFGQQLEPTLHRYRR
jgi:hypothetical protein